mgnify:FL=1|tara:strand:+ start:1904 stop:2254 length:351 start_codon:yes stop_codon:yes gene_type:complete
MAHFAKVVEGIVEQVIVAEQDFIDSIEGLWIQTSYNTHKNIHYGEDGEPDGGTALRKNFAGVGYNYDATDDFFYSQPFFTSWILNRTTGVWEAPVPYPADGVHTWDEDTTSWVEVA